MDVCDHYGELHGKARAVLQSILDNPKFYQQLTVSHNYLLDYERLRLAISHRPESSVADHAMVEYQRALLALTKGQYRYAYSGLRLFFELMLSVVHFSAHEIDLHLWLKDSKDISWGSLKAPDTGVLSAGFIKAFSPALSENAKQYSAIAEQVYRECSEYVHGNAHTHRSLPNDILFDEVAFLEWHQKAASIRMVVVFVFAARYMSGLDSESADKVEPVFVDVLGHIAAVQGHYAAA